MDNAEAILRVDYGILPTLYEDVIAIHPGIPEIQEIDMTAVRSMKPYSRVMPSQYWRRIRGFSRRFLDIRILEELIKTPSAVPEEWKHRQVFFWGTIYQKYRYTRWNPCVASAWIGASNIEPLQLRYIHHGDDIFPDDLSPYIP